MRKEPDAVQVESLKFELQLKLEREKLKNSVRLEEFKSLRSEINDMVKEKFRFQSAALIASAAYYGWIFSRIQGLKCGTMYNSHIIQVFVQYFPWTVPVCLAFLATWRAYGDGKSIKRIAEYLQLYEASFKDREVDFAKNYPMWETYLHEHRAKFFRRNLFTRLKNSDLAFWIFLLIAMIVFAIVGPIIAPGYCIPL